MTPIQILKAEIHKIGITQFPINFLAKIIKLEKLEKEIIVEAYAEGFLKTGSGEDYFNEKFKQNDSKKRN